MSSIYNYENRDTEYRGLQREDGMRWHGDFEWYEEPDDPIYMSVSQDLDGEWQASVIYIGGYNNVCLTVREEAEVREQFPDRQDRLKYLWENYRRPMETDYIEDPVYETKAQKELREKNAKRIDDRLRAAGLDPDKQFRLLDEETKEEKLAREAAGGVKG